MTQSAETAIQRDRSPAYPIVPLEMAFARLVEFDAHFKRSAARPEKVGDAWGIKAKAHADRVMAALRYYGLLEYQGAGTKDRSVIVSEEGRKYLRAQQEHVKREVIKAAALRPKQIAKFWSEWGADRPADAACLDVLVLKNDFSEGGAREFLKVFDATISFAKLSDSDKKAAVAEDVGDDKPETPPVTPHVQPPPKPAMTPHPLPPKQSGVLQEVFNLEEGPVTLTFPASLSGDSYQDLADHLAIILRKAKRRSEAEQQAKEIERRLNPGDDEP